MGIKGLTQFIRSKAPGVITPTHLREYKGATLAVDTAIYIFKYKCVAGPQWISSFVSMVSMFAKYGIKPIYVFDSQAPPEKLKEQQRRRVLARLRGQDTEYLINALEYYKQSGVCDPLLWTFYQKNCYKSLISTSEMIYPRCNSVKCDTNNDDNNDNNNDNIINHELMIPIDHIETVSECLAAKQKQNISITSTDIALLKQLFDKMNVDYCQALSEAEATCSYFKKQQDIDAILTDDSDILCYGCDYLSKLSGDGACVYTNHDALLDQLEITKPQFVDFCICLGTDYNERVKGFGPVKALNVIKNVGSLDYIPEYKHIDFERIRQLFGPTQFKLQIHKTLKLDSKNNNNHNNNNKDILCPELNPTQSLNEFLFINNIDITEQ